MKYFTLTALATLLPVINAQLTYNLTAALAPGQYEKYRCLTTEAWNKRLPICIRRCQTLANQGDGCAFDDFACHCVNSERFSNIIEPCVFPPSLGGQGNCTLAELGQARPLITDLCNFFNATLYAAYTKCPQCLSVNETLTTLATETVVVTY